ncbi:hypothetical protein ES332_A04G132300v1 [Gossypium tomentosum]|uniref:Uncharacterized protein n=1 Tax=Gossypium tomentosum TaxID=34277 RepID=A0A5D2QYJ3_GOSTO|nr:hypothetical protein ES332_A04G132300v1 [Gossypium tomentosum]
MAAAAAATISSDSLATVSDGPVLSFINKRLRALRKKYNRILQMEESVSQGKTLNKEQEDVLRSKPTVSALIDELEKLLQPLSSAVSEEISLALQRQTVSSSETTSQAQPDKTEPQEQLPNVPDHAIEDLLNLLYFGSLFDVKSQSDFTSTMLTRTHERGCCLTYDYNALHRCIQHAMLWLSNSDQPVDPNADVSYAGLRERLNKIMALDYFTTTPEIKDPAEVAAAAAAGTYTSFQVPVHAVRTSVPVQVEDSVGQYQQKAEDASNYQETETGDNQFSTTEELRKDPALQDNLEKENQEEDITVQEEEHGKLQVDNGESKEQLYVPRRPHQNQRGGRRGYFVGRGGRSSGRGGVTYQNGHNQYYDQPANHYSRNHYNNRGRGGRGGGGHAYNNHDGNPSADVGVAS